MGTRPNGEDAQPRPCNPAIESNNRARGEVLFQHDCTHRRIYLTCIRGREGKREEHEIQPRGVPGSNRREGSFRAPVTRSSHADHVGAGAHREQPGFGGLHDNRVYGDARPFRQGLAQ
jgi:hypothetical protein